MLSSLSHKSFSHYITAIFTNSEFSCIVIKFCRAYHLSTYYPYWHVSSLVLLIFHQVWGLYKGIASPFLGISAMNSLRFGVYGNVLYYLERERTSRPAMKNVAVAGAVSGVAKLSLVVPIELVRIRMQLQGVGQKSQSMIPSRYSSGSTSRGRVYKSSFDCAVQLWRSGKLKAFYQGGVATAYRDVVGGAMYLLVWEKCSRVLAKGSDTHNLSVFQRLLAGGLTGVIGWTTVYPFDVVKTRMQLDGVSRKRVYSSTADCIKKSLKNEGYKFIFKGIAPTLLRAFPANAAFFTTYSFVMTYFHQQRQFVGN